MSAPPTLNRAKSLKINTSSKKAAVCIRQSLSPAAAGRTIKAQEGGRTHHFKQQVRRSPEGEAPRSAAQMAAAQPRVLPGVSARMGKTQPGESARVSAEQPTPRSPGRTAERRGRTVKPPGRPKPPPRWFTLAQLREVPDFAEAVEKRRKAAESGQKGAK